MIVELIKMVNILSKSTLNSSTYHIHMQNKKKARLEEEFDNMLWLWSGKCNLKSYDRRPQINGMKIRDILHSLSRGRSIFIPRVMMSIYLSPTNTYLTVEPLPAFVISTTAYCMKCLFITCYSGE